MAENPARLNTGLTNPLAEYIIDFAIEFFSKPESLNKNPIENYFIPVLLNFSHKLNAGKTLDVRIFKSQLTHDQREFCKRTFKNAKTLKLNTNRIQERDIFPFISHFRLAKQLFIEINDDDTFVFQNRTVFETIKIFTKEKALWLDPINQILKNNLKVVTDLSLENGYLTNNAIQELWGNEITHLELKNIILYTDTDQQTLIRYISRLQNLTSLKLVYTRVHSDFLNPFNTIFQNLTELLKKPLENLKNLAFHARQEHEPINYQLQLFPNLTELEIFYTVERNFTDIESLIQTLNQNKQEKIANPTKIVFREFLTKHITQYTQTDIEQFKQNSIQYKEKIIILNSKLVSFNPLIKYEN